MPGCPTPSVKRSLLLIIAVLAVLPAIQKGFRPVYSKGLDGYSEPNPLPVFRFDSLFAGTWQPRLTRHFDRGIGFHNDLVRLHNQIDYTLFNLLHARKVVAGKNNYLFEESYLTAFSGEDFIGEKIVEARSRQFRYAQEGLGRKGILFLVLLAPDKGTYYPEYVPDRYRRRAGAATNYDTYCARLKEFGVNHLDFNAWFGAMKDTSRYPLYPKYGIHWSRYGSYLAFDSLVKYLSAVTGRSLPRPQLTGLRVVRQAEGRDNDMERACNLLCRMPAPDLAYPEVRFNGSSGAEPFRALFVGDSFYFGWAEAGFIGKVFSNRDFWYYDQEVYSGTYPTGKQAKNQDIAATVARMNAVIFLQTNAGNGEVGYYFTDRLIEKGGI